MTRPILLLALCASAGCRGDEFTTPLVLGGVEVPAATLNHGMKVYRRTCASCHGIDGNGLTSAKNGDVQPRNFKRGAFKFVSTPDNGLPTDEDLVRTVKNGLKGTQMQGFPDLMDDEVLAVTQYIKTFSPRWRREAVTKVVPIAPDPWSAGRRQEAIARGRLVYHGLAMCWTCHPAYAKEDELLSMARAMDVERKQVPRRSIPLRSDLDQPARVETEYGKLLPPDFLGDTLRAARGVNDLYRAIAAGIGGTPMPTWYNKLSVQDLWAVVYYVRELARFRGTPQAAAYRSGLPGVPSSPLQ